MLWLPATLVEGSAPWPCFLRATFATLAAPLDLPAATRSGRPGPSQEFRPKQVFGL